MAEQLKLLKQEDESYFENALKVFNQAMKSFTELVSEGCKEQGVVLTGLWEEYQKVVHGKIAALEKRTEEKECEMNQLGCNLLSKVENKLRQYEEQTDVLSQKIEQFEAENATLREMLRDYEVDQETLLGKYAELKESTKKLKNTADDCIRYNKALKVLLMKSDTDPQS